MRGKAGSVGPEHSLKSLDMQLAPVASSAKSINPFNILILPDFCSQYQAVVLSLLRRKLSRASKMARIHSPFIRRHKKCLFRMSAFRPPPAGMWHKMMRHLMQARARLSLFFASCTNARPKTSLLILAPTLLICRAYNGE